MATYTMQELELETAELLPARETLNCYCGRSSHSSTTLFQSGNGNGDGNGNWAGLVNISGNLDGLTIF